MHDLSGHILISSPTLYDPHFSHTRIFLATHNENGVFGFVINQPFHRSLNELEEFKQYPPLHLYKGGPVDQEHLYFLHTRPDLVNGGSLVVNGIYLGGDFQQALQSLAPLPERNHFLKIFIGYAGWDTGELEAEIAEGSWLLAAKTTAASFSKMHE